jgi:hypothetical protein
MRQAKGARGLVLGGWAINGIVQLQSGLPVTVQQTGDSQNTGPSSNQRPNVAAGQAVPRADPNRTLNRWFNTAAFVRSKCDGCAGDGIYLELVPYYRCPGAAGGWGICAAEHNMTILFDMGKS